MVSVNRGALGVVVSGQTMATRGCGANGLLCETLGLDSLLGPLRNNRLISGEEASPA